jgi:hypothetical protein
VDGDVGDDLGRLLGGIGGVATALPAEVLAADAAGFPLITLDSPLSKEEGSSVDVEVERQRAESREQRPETTYLQVEQPVLERGPLLRRP